MKHCKIRQEICFAQRGRCALLVEIHSCRLGQHSRALMRPPVCWQCSLWRHGWQRSTQTAGDAEQLEAKVHCSRAILSTFHFESLVLRHSHLSSILSRETKSEQKIWNESRSDCVCLLAQKKSCELQIHMVARKQKKCDKLLENSDPKSGWGIPLRKVLKVSVYLFFESLLARQLEL